MPKTATAKKTTDIVIDWSKIKEIAGTEAEKLAAVKEDGYNIQYIFNPSEEVQLAAVKEDGYNIQYIFNPSEDVMKAALAQDPSSIRFFKAAWKESFPRQVATSINKTVFAATQCGKPLDPDLYTWDEASKTFATLESNVMLDFNSCDHVSVSAGPFAVVNVGDNCTVNVRMKSIVYTGDNCNIVAGSRCALYIGSNCHIKTVGGKSVAIYDNNGDLQVDTLQENCEFEGDDDGTLSIADNKNEVTLKLTAAQLEQVRSMFPTC